MKRIVRRMKILRRRRKKMRKKREGRKRQKSKEKRQNIFGTFTETILSREAIITFGYSISHM